MSIKIMGEKYGLGQAKGGRFDILLFEHDHIHILTITSSDDTNWNLVCLSSRCFLDCLFERENKISIFQKPWSRYKKYSSSKTKREKNKKKTIEIQEKANILTSRRITK
jgi:hypothetical protein